MAYVVKPRKDTETPEVKLTGPGGGTFQPGSKVRGPKQPSRRRSGAFVNLQKYLQANVGEGQRIAESLARGTEKEAAKGLAELGKVEHEYKEKAKESAVYPDIEKISTITPKIISGTATEEEKEYLRGITEAEYKGPPGISPDESVIYELSQKEKLGPYDAETNPEGITEAEQKKLDAQRGAKEEAVTRKAVETIEEKVKPRFEEAARRAEALAPTARTPEEEAIYGKRLPQYETEIAREFKRPTYTRGQTALDVYLMGQVPYAPSRFQRLKETVMGTAATPRELGESEEDYQKRLEQEKILKGVGEQAEQRMEAAAQFARQQEYQTRLASSMAKQALYGTETLPTPEDFEALTPEQREQAVTDAKASLDSSEELLGNLRQQQETIEQTLENAERELFLAQQAAAYIREGDVAQAEAVNKRIGDAQVALEQAQQSKMFYDNAVSNAFTAREYYRKTHNDLVRLAWQILHPGEQPPVPGVDLFEKSEFGRQYLQYQADNIDLINKRLFDEDLSQEEIDSLMQRRDTLLKQISGVTDLSLVDLDKVYADLGINIPGRLFRERQADINRIDQINNRLVSEDIPADEEDAIIAERDQLLTRLAGDLGIELKPETPFVDVYDAIELAHAPTSTMRRDIDQQVTDFDQLIRDESIDVLDREAAIDEFLRAKEAGEILPRAALEMQPIVEQYNADLEAKRQEFLGKFEGFPTDAERESYLESVFATTQGEEPTLKGRLADSFRQFYDEYQAQLQRKKDQLNTQLTTYDTDAQREQLFTELSRAIDNNEITGSYADFILEQKKDHYKKVDEAYNFIDETFDGMKNEAGFVDSLGQEVYLGELANRIASGQITGELARSVTEFIDDYHRTLNKKVNDFKLKFAEAKVADQESIIGDTIQKIESGEISGIYRDELEALFSNYNNIVVPARENDINEVIRINDKIASEDLDLDEENHLIGKRDAILDTLAESYGLPVDQIYTQVVQKQPPLKTRRQLIDEELGTFLENYDSYPVPEKEYFLDDYTQKLMTGEVPERIIPDIETKINEYNALLDASNQDYINRWYNPAVIPVVREADMAETRNQIIGNQIQGKLAARLNSEIDNYYESVDTDYANIKNTFLNNFKDPDGTNDIASQESYLGDLLENTPAGHLRDMVQEYADNYYADLTILLDKFKENFDHMLVPEREEEIEQIIAEAEAGELEGHYGDEVRKVIDKYNLDVNNFIQLNTRFVDDLPTAADKEKQINDLAAKIETRDDLGNAQIEGRAAREIQDYINKYWSDLNADYTNKMQAVENAFSTGALSGEQALKSLLDSDISGKLRKDFEAYSKDYYKSLDKTFGDFSSRVDASQKLYEESPDRTVRVDAENTANADIQSIQNAINSGAVTGYLQEKYQGYINDYNARKAQELQEAKDAYNALSPEEKIAKYEELEAVKDSLTKAEKDVYDVGKLFTSDRTMEDYLELNKDAAESDEAWFNQQMKPTVASTGDITNRWITGDYAAGYHYADVNALDKDGISIALSKKFRESLNAEQDNLRQALEDKLAAGMQLTAAELLSLSRMNEQEAQDAQAQELYSKWKDETLPKDKEEWEAQLLQSGNQTAIDMYEEEMSRQAKLEELIMNEIQPEAKRQAADMYATVAREINNAKIRMQGSTNFVNDIVSKWSTSSSKNIKDDGNLRQILGGDAGNLVTFYNPMEGGSGSWLSTMGLDMRSYIQAPMTRSSISMGYQNLQDTLDFNNVLPPDAVEKWNNLQGFLDPNFVKKGYNPVDTNYKFNKDAFTADYKKMVNSALATFKAFDPRNMRMSGTLVIQSGRDHLHLGPKNVSSMLNEICNRWERWQDGVQADSQRSVRETINNVTKELNTLITHMNGTFGMNVKLQPTTYSMNNAEQIYAAAKDLRNRLAWIDSMRARTQTTADRLRPDIAQNDYAKMIMIPKLSSIYISPDQQVTHYREGTGTPLEQGNKILQWSSFRPRPSTWTETIPGENTFEENTETEVNELPDWMV